MFLPRRKSSNDQNGVTGDCATNSDPAAAAALMDPLRAQIALMDAKAALLAAANATQPNMARRGGGDRRRRRDGEPPGLQLIAQL